MVEVRRRTGDASDDPGHSGNLRWGITRWRWAAERLDNGHEQVRERGDAGVHPGGEDGRATGTIDQGRYSFARRQVDISLVIKNH